MSIIHTMKVLLVNESRRERGIRLLLVLIPVTDAQFS